MLLTYLELVLKYMTSAMYFPNYFNLCFVDGSRKQTRTSAHKKGCGSTQDNQNRRLMATLAQREADLEKLNKILVEQ